MLIRVVCNTCLGGGTCGLPDDCVGVPNPDHGSGGGAGNMSALDRMMDGFHQDSHWATNANGWAPRS